MLDTSQVIPFLLAGVVLFLVPCVDTALVTRQAVVHGRRTAFTTFGGLLTGGVMHASAATAGLSAILSVWLDRPTVQRVIERVTGVVFVLLGLRLAAEL